MANILRRLLGPSESQVQAEVQNQVNAYLRQWMPDGPMIIPSIPTYPKIDQKGSVERGYVSNADVYSIVSRKARMAAGIPLYVYRVKGKEGRKALREYKALTTGDKFTPESIMQAQLLKVKAMEEVEEDHPLNQLLQKPNETDSPSEFWEQCYGFLDITGNTYIYKESPKMGANEGKPKRMCTLPSQFMSIVPDGLGPSIGVVGYIFFLWGNMGITKEEIIHVKYFNPDYQPDGSHLYGMPPLRAGAKTLERSNSAVDSSTAQFQHGGPAGMVFNEALKPDDVNGAQVGALKKKWEAETQGNKNRGKILFSAGKLGYLQMGLSPVDLKILESEIANFRQLCNIFNMPSAIFNDMEHATMANLEQFYKAAYTDGVIPMVIKMRDALNSFLLPDFGADGEYFIDADYSNIPVLQVDMKTLTEWLDKSWEITPNERRALKKFGKFPDPNMDKIWMPSGLDMMDNIAMPVESIEDDVAELTKGGNMPYK